MPRPKGTPKTGGNKRGLTKSKSRALGWSDKQPGEVGWVTELILDRLGLNTFEELANICAGKVPCSECNGDKLVDRTVIERRKNGDELITGTVHHRVTCRHCNGTGREPVPLRLKARILSELCTYQAPKLAAVAVQEIPAKSAVTLDEIVESERRAIERHEQRLLSAAEGEPQVIDVEVRPC